MHYEFEQLLEAKWAGCLDEYGRRRLSELCAANPALARRMEQEESLDGLLERCGPNHAPFDLADKVLAQLEPRRSRYVAPRRSSWLAWVFRPAFGAALAFCVMAAVGIEAGLLIYKMNGGGSGGGRFSNTASKQRTGRAEREIAYVRTGPEESRNSRRTSRPSPKKVEKTTRTAQPTRVRANSADRDQVSAASKAKAPSAAPAEQAPVAEPLASVQGQPEGAPPTVEFPAAGAPAETDLEPQLAYALPAPSVNAPAVAPQTAAAPVAPAATPAVPPVQGTPAVVLPNPAIPGPRVIAKAAPSAPAPAKPMPAMQEPQDRQVAMDIFLTPTPQASRGNAGAGERAAVQSLPPGIKTFVQPDEAQPKPQALSLKDIHITLISIMGSGAPDITPQPVDGRKDQWEVRLSLTPDQFRRFTTELRKMGVLPGETVVGEASAGAPQANLARSFSTNHYEIRHGKEWMKPMEALAPGQQAKGGRRAGEGKINVSIRIEQLGRAGAR